MSEMQIAHTEEKSIQIAIAWCLAWGGDHAHWSMVWGK